MARATRRAGVEHVVWSTLEDTRKWVPLDDARLPTLMGKYKVPHFDAKGEADAIFAAEAAPTSYLLAAFYWENFIYFGMGPRKGDDGNLVLALPLGGAPLPGIAAGTSAPALTGSSGAAERGGRARGRGGRGAHRFGDGGGVHAPARPPGLVPRHALRRLPRPRLPGAEDLGNMFQFHACWARSSSASARPRPRAPSTEGTLLRRLAGGERRAHPIG